jgi:hypothetical protein
MGKNPTMAAELDLFEPLTDDEINAVLQLKAAVSSLVEVRCVLVGVR